MGWSKHPFSYKLPSGAKSLLGCALALTGSLALTVPASGQTVTTVSSNQITLSLGNEATLGGTIGLATTSFADSGPSQTLIFGGAIRPTGTVTGSHVYVRVDGGIAAGGYDYIFGDTDTTQTSEGGTWVIAPVSTGNYINAVWATKAISGYNPKIQIAFNAALLYDTARLQFIVRNTDIRIHSVAIAIIEDINATQPTTLGGTAVGDGPLRISSLPYLNAETLYAGGKVPTYWETFAQIPGVGLGNPQGLQSIRGTIQPTQATLTEPTPPVRFAYGPSSVLNGSYTSTAPLQRYRNVWNFQADPTALLTGTTATTNNAAVGLYYGDTSIAPSQTNKIVTYIGQSNSDSDLAPPLAVNVTSRQSISYAYGAPSPSTFTILATVENLSDLVGTGSAGSSITASLALTLPSGLKIISGNPTLTVASLATQAAAVVGWVVAPDTSVTTAPNFQPGTYTYTVTATYPATSGSTTTTTKTVQRSIEIAAPLNFTLIGEHGVTNRYRMISFPYSSNGDAPSQTFRLNGLSVNLSTNDFDIRRYNPTTGIYDAVTAIQPGVGYWFRLNTNADAQISVDTTRYKPTAAATTAVNFSAGWNVIGDPYLFSLRFSNIMIMDTQTKQMISVQDAASSQYQWISPTVYRLDTSDTTNQNNWHYVQPTGLGFLMKPFEGYWVYFRKSNLQLIYPFPDTPLGVVLP